ncbi:hypothetical protein V5799_013986 [Amblyomma americanum]|uniref:Uncharacterized protein n=1 Tax=Amblyomma americanum TaxID=6943 RepID=A0AAQ4E4B7_AMBAM
MRLCSKELLAVAKTIPPHKLNKAKDAVLVTDHTTCGQLVASLYRMQQEGVKATGDFSAISMDLLVIGVTVLICEYSTIILYAISLTVRRW